MVALHSALLIFPDTGWTNLIILVQYFNFDFRGFFTKDEAENIISTGRSLRPRLQHLQHRPLPGPEEAEAGPIPPPLGRHQLRAS